MTFKIKTPAVAGEVAEYFSFIHRYVRLRGYHFFARFEIFKDLIVDLLYKKRGRYARPFLHFGIILLSFIVITFGPVILDQANQEDQAQAPLGVIHTATAVGGTSFATLQAEEVRQFRGGEIIIHSVEEGETVSSIAQKYGLDPSTILWENELSSNAKLKPGDNLTILPVDGVRHKVKRGETIYTVGKKYGLDSAQVQSIVDYPFNEFLNDETFELATGQVLIVPGGIIQTAAAPAPVTRRSLIDTPDAGSVTATGSFVWPASGRITQSYHGYHRGIDIASGGGGPILAADAGTVVGAGWLDNSGYGNRVLIDHGNGFITLYAHMSSVSVRTGQRVNRGDLIGQMGSTGRSTGIHLHFEIRRGGVLLNPLSFLQ